MQNIREKEIQLLSKMLNLTSGSTGTSSVDFNDQWKVLIYDHAGRDIISPLLSVPALRQRGVTLHLMLHSEREAVPDAPAVYFVAPTEENLTRIAQDCEKALYRAVHLHFTTRIERALLEKFAQQLVSSKNPDAVGLVSKMYDQYLDVIALEENLFTLNVHNSFAAYNEASLSEAQIRSFMHRVAMGLLSTVRVMSTLPVIRAPPGGAAAMLAQELNSLLKENISPRGPTQSLFEDCLHERARPLLVILDRGADLFPVLQHHSQYQALVADLCDLKLNRVTLDIADKGSSVPKRKTYDLSTATDSFLSRNASSLFHIAVEASQRELAQVSQREKEIRSRPEAESEVAMDREKEHVAGKDLSEAIESLPDILHRKALLEAHTNVMQSVMREISKREIPTFAEQEQMLLTEGVRDRVALLDLLRDGSKGSVADKARLLALIAVTLVSSGGSTAETNMDDFESAFQEGAAAVAAAGSPSADPAAATNNTANSAPSEEVAEYLAAVQFVRRLLTLQASPAMRMGGGGGGGRGLSSLLNTATNKLMNKAAAFFAKFTPFYATRVVHGLAEGRGTEDEIFITLDPRAREGGTSPFSSSSSLAGGASGGVSSGAAGSAGSGYNDVIVFVLGGGCYAEWFNLQELLKDKASSGSLRHIVYGCTDLVSGEEFLQQLRQLGANK